MIYWYAPVRAIVARFARLQNQLRKEVVIRRAVRTPEVLQITSLNEKCEQGRMPMQSSLPCEKSEVELRTQLQLACRMCRSDHC